MVTGIIAVVTVTIKLITSLVAGDPPGAPNEEPEIHVYLCTSERACEALVGDRGRWDLEDEGWSHGGSQGL